MWHVFRLSQEEWLGTIDVDTLTLTNQTYIQPNFRLELGWLVVRFYNQNMILLLNLGPIWVTEWNRISTWLNNNKRGVINRVRSKVKNISKQSTYFSCSSSRLPHVISNFEYSLTFDLFTFARSCTCYAPTDPQML